MTVYFITSIETVTYLNVTEVTQSLFKPDSYCVITDDGEAHWVKGVKNLRMVTEN